MDQITSYVTFGILSWGLHQSTACEPTYSEEELNFRHVSVLQTGTWHHQNSY